MNQLKKCVIEGCNEQWTQEHHVIPSVFSEHDGHVESDFLSLNPGLASSTSFIQQADLLPFKHDLFSRASPSVAANAAVRANDSVTGDEK